MPDGLAPTPTHIQHFVPNPIEERLPETHFRRVHRSAGVNLEYLDRIVRNDNSTHSVFLRGTNAELPLGRSHAGKLKEHFK